MIFVFIIIILEGAITTDVFLNSNWEEVRIISFCCFFPPLSLSLSQYNIMVFNCFTNITVCMYVFLCNGMYFLLFDR